MRKTRKKFKRSHKSSSNMGKRISVLVSIFVILTGILSARLYYLQIVKGRDYSAFARGIHFQAKDNQPPRGDIYFQDQAGEQRYLVATNRTSHFVYADPKEIEDAQDT